MTVALGDLGSTSSVIGSVVKLYKDTDFQFKGMNDVITFLDVFLELPRNNRGSDYWTLVGVTVFNS